MTGRTVPDAVTSRTAPDAVVTLTAADLGWLPGGWAHGLLIGIGGLLTTCDEALVLAYHRPPDPALGRADLGGELEFGQRLGLALQVAQAQADSAALTLLKDRDRIARDLHDLVIQRLFAIGLSLQAAGVAARVPEVQDRLSRAVDDIDETIKDVRRTIFELHTETPRTPRSSLKDRIDEVLTDLAEVLPPQIDVHVGNGLDEVPPEIGADLVAALRETLTNAARHARATTVQVYVTVGRDVDLEVVDDGVGLPPTHHTGNGLTNLAERAAAHSGGFEIAAGPDGGTVARWAVPLP
jgi:signal transduction histidine kinase